MIDPYVQNSSYWLFRVVNNQLLIAPFGLASTFSPVLYFSELNQSNEDRFGWWHIACSFQFNISVSCHLSNSEIGVSRSASLINLLKTMPIYSMIARFGFQPNGLLAPTNFLVKEIRLWNTILSRDVLDTQKYNQIDPTLQSDLLLYLRFNSI